MPLSAANMNNCCSQPKSSPLVLLKPGENPPFFITHGLGGNVIELCKLVEQIRTTSAIYGIQWRGLDGVEPPDRSIQDMAHYFMRAIVNVQAHGPYLLAGLSTGGLPMLEVARYLSARGERVALLALLDTYPHPRHWPLKSWVDFVARRLQHHIFAFRHLPLGRVLPRFSELCRGLVAHIRSRRGSSPRRSESLEVPSALDQLRQSTIEASAKYRPSHYRGKLTFIRAEIASTFPADAGKVWGNLVSQIEIHNINCIHVGLITTHAETVADKLSFCLEKALPFQGS